MTASTPRTVTTEQYAALPEQMNVTDLVLQRLASHGQEIAYELPVSTAAAGQAGSTAGTASPQSTPAALGWEPVTLAEFVQLVRSCAKAFLAAGLKPGERVAVMCPTDYVWAVLDQAIWFAGGVSVPIYETSSPYQVEHILGDSGATMVCVYAPNHADVVAQAVKSLGSDLPVHKLGSVADLTAFAARGEAIADAELETARSHATLSDVATVVYTSGTTGRPKGAEITHGNLCLTAVNIVPFAQEILSAPETPNTSETPSRADGQPSTLMFLPLAHVLARAVQYICLVSGVRLGHIGQLKDLLPGMQSFQPTFVLAVPRVFEKVFAGAQEKADSPLGRKVFTAAEATAIAYAQAEEQAALGEGRGPGPLLRARHQLFDRLVYQKIRELFGGRVRYAISGASTLDPHLGYFFAGAGIGMQEGYGLTETTAPATLNIPGRTRVGSVGLPLPGVEIRLADDGEILIRGPVVFAGYYGDTSSTREALDAEGFLHTGDLGALDSHGFLKILGRKKELIVTAGGKNVYPTPMEEQLRKDQLIAHAIIVGENKPFVSALLALDPDALTQWAQKNQRSDFDPAHAGDDEELRKYLQQRVDEVNQCVSRAESIREFRIIPVELSERSGHVTPSLKLQRAKVMQDFDQLVADIYRKSSSR